MTDGITNLAGIDIPSNDPTFLAVVGIHILLGLACTVTGVVATLSPKRLGRHPQYGTIYFWCLAQGLRDAAAGSNCQARWAQDYALFYPGSVVVCNSLLGSPSQTAPLA